MWALCLLSQGLGIGLFAGGSQPWLLYPGIILIGIGNSGSILCLIMTFSNWFGAQAAPVVFGFGSAFSATCGALAPVASGYSYDLVGSFAPVFYGISGGCIVGSLVLAMTRPPKLNSVSDMSDPLLASP